MATTVKSITSPSLGVGDTATLFYRKSSADTATELSYTRTTSSDSATKTWQIPVEYDVEYTYSIRVTTSDGTTTWPTNGATFTVASPTPSPSPSYSISSGSTSATANISNLSSGNSVVFRVLIPASGAIIGSSSGTASGASMSLTVSGLASSTTYRAQVLVDGTSIGYTDFTTEQGEPAHSITAGDDYVTIRFYNYLSTDTLTVEVGDQSASRTGNGSVTISGLEPGTSYSGNIYVNGVLLELFAFTTTGTATSNDPYIFNSGISDNTGTEAFVVVYNTKSTYTADMTINGVSSGTYSCSDSSTTFFFDTEPYSIYEVVLVINGVTLTTTIDTTPNTGEFQWDTSIYKGAKINSWQNPANGATYPAPVTASEWNRLVTLVNQKCGTSIATVSSGASMVASSGGNIRLVADALGVSVASESFVTAQFFLDLQDAINNM